MLDGIGCCDLAAACHSSPVLLRVIFSVDLKGIDFAKVRRRLGNWRPQDETNNKQARWLGMDVSWDTGCLVILSELFPAGAGAVA